MIRITNIKLPLTYHDGMLTDTAAKALGIEKAQLPVFHFSNGRSMHEEKATCILPLHLTL